VLRQIRDQSSELTVVLCRVCHSKAVLCCHDIERAVHERLADGGGRAFTCLVARPEVLPAAKRSVSRASKQSCGASLWLLQL
jgi:hypothetical protein